MAKAYNIHQQTLFACSAQDAKLLPKTDDAIAGSERLKDSIKGYF